jgi:hypothetical protein
MDMDTLGIYYPDNSEFAYFVFQQVLADGTQSDDEYTLIAYAINTDGEVMDDLTFDPPLTHHSLLAGHRIQFANINVYPDDLDELFNNAPPTTSLKLFPRHSVNYPKHIAYELEGGLLERSKTVDPSPPAPSH